MPVRLLESALTVALDDPIVVLGSAPGIEQGIDVGVITALAVLAVEIPALLRHRHRLRTDMDLRLAIDALFLEPSVVEAGVQPMALHLGVEVLAPGDT